MNRPPRHLHPSRGYTGKSHFYRANRELGRIFKTAHILKYMSDKTLCQRIRKGLLKGEQIHALARDLNYGKRGRISTANLREQKKSCSCTTLILASIIYWHAREINRVVMECDPEGNGINLQFMQHISPIAWVKVSWHTNSRLFLQSTPRGVSGSVQDSN